MDLLAEVPDPGMTDPSPVAIYIHFPFCRYLCTYCDFDTFAGLDHLVERYLAALLLQIRGSPGVPAGSLYVGGGTPSLMSPPSAAALLDACRRQFGLVAGVEATVEANPSGLGRDRLEGFRRAGFNRLSLGVQSLDDRLLRLLGRRHRAAEVGVAVADARAAGFDNLSVDLIYGVPRQTVESWRETLESVVEWEVEHISCYMLGLESGTPLERGVGRGILAMPSDEETVAMYAVAREVLGRAAYRRYEISNFARAGFESTHNLAYWRNRPYLGLGAGAAGCWQGRRYKIAPDIEAYVEGVRLGRLPLAEDEAPDPRRAMSDTLILGLRLDEGVSRADFLRRHGSAPEDLFGDILEWAESASLLERSGDRLKLTERGVLLSNELFQRLL